MAAEDDKFKQRIAPLEEMGSSHVTIPETQGMSVEDVKAMVALAQKEKDEKERAERARAEKEQAAKAQVDTRPKSKAVTDLGSTALPSPLSLFSKPTPAEEEPTADAVEEESERTMMAPHPAHTLATAMTADALVVDTEADAGESTMLASSDVSLTNAHTSDDEDEAGESTMLAEGVEVGESTMLAEDADVGESTMLAPGVEEDDEESIAETMEPTQVASLEMLKASIGPGSDQQEDGGEVTHVASIDELMRAGSIHAGVQTVAAPPIRAESDYIVPDDAADIDPGTIDSGGLIDSKTAFDDPKLRAMRDAFLAESREERRRQGEEAARAARAVQAQATPQEPSHATPIMSPSSDKEEPPSELFATVVDSQISLADVERVIAEQKAMARERKVSQSKELSAPSTIPISRGTHTHSSEVASKRSCLCDHHHANEALNSLATSGGGGGNHLLFFMCSLLLGVGGAFGMVWAVLPRLNSFSGIFASVCLCLGGGLIAGSLLTIGAGEQQRTKLLLESIVVSVCVVGVWVVFLFLKLQPAPPAPANGIISLDSWGQPWVRETLLWWLSVLSGLIAGWTFRLSASSQGAEAHVSYATLVGELLDPHMEHAGRSYDDVLVRSKGEFKFFPASMGDQVSKEFTCSYCYRPAAQLQRESEGREWLAWVLVCPHCDEGLCIQHFADNAWQCRACGKSIRARIQTCDDGGTPPSGQRAVLCPVCHRYKGSPEQYKNRQWTCPSCASDVRAYVETYGHI